MNLKEIFGSAGPLSENLSTYEYRPQQLQMAEAVARAIREEKHLMAEAGTGVGKSFAYLIPAIGYAASSSGKVVVSTNTISLQEQLIKKDLPLLRDVLPVSFKAILVKGRSNYLCLRRWERANTLTGTSRQQEDLFETPQEAAELGMISEWLRGTEGGSLSDFQRKPSPRVWVKVCSERDNCLGKKCPYREKCFFQRARKKMGEANLLIVNHHLFFSDLALKRTKVSFLPLYRCVILDEAHNIESVASEHLGIEISNFRVKYLLDSLYNEKKNKGFLLYLRAGKTLEYVNQARAQARTFFREVSKSVPGVGSRLKRIHKPHFFSNPLEEPLRRIYSSLKDLRAKSRTKEDELEIGSYMGRCLDLANELAAFLGQMPENHVYWIEVGGKKRSRVILRSSPINISGELREKLFEEIPSVIMTSATLGTDNSFQYLKERIGLEDSLELQAGSPFDYRKQVRLYIPGNMPEPGDNREYRRRVIEKVKRYLEMTGGKAFVLFTSYRMLEKVYEVLHPYLAEKGINSFRQGKGLPRNTMLEKFRKDINSVLFGTDSFWAGVDVQGEALSNVIITKLPFDVPDHPLIEARIEDIKERGGDPFLEYSLPEAIIKLKQGFGRLIRNKEDKGIVAILDNRLLTRSYGKRFLNSLPPCRIIVD